MNRRGRRDVCRQRLAVLLGVVLLIACGEPRWCRAQSQTADTQGDAEALSTRFRFVEKYRADKPDQPDQPDATGLLLNLYQVASRETIKVTKENPQGAPKPDNTVLQTIYTEHVSKVTKDGFAEEVVRRYDKAYFKTTVEVQRRPQELLQGLTVLYRLQKGAMPLVLGLTPGRQLRREEFGQISQQSYLPILSRILPRQPVRVSDSWPVPREAAWALLGSVPADEEYNLTAELLEVHKDKGKDGKAIMVAVFGVQGQCVVPQGPSAINARISFQFERTVGTGAGDPAKAATPATGRPDRKLEGVYQAVGYISRVSLAQDVTQELPESDGRFKQLVHRVIVLERKKEAQELVIPSPIPPPSVENTWLVYDDPKGRFHLLHPQELRVRKEYPDGGIDLIDPRPEGQDVVRLMLLPRTGDPQKDRLAADPTMEQKRLKEEWRKQHENVKGGNVEPLPDTDWNPLKWKVYRIEAALKPEEAAGAPASDRLYLDEYIVQFARNEALIATAMTTREPHTKFRETAEKILKSFDFGPYKESASSEGQRPAASR